MSQTNKNSDESYAAGGQVTGGLRAPHQGEAGDQNRGSFRAVVWTEACGDTTGAEMVDSETDNTFKEFCYKETKKQHCDPRSMGAREILSKSKCVH